jgi:hypothetical protein
MNWKFDDLTPREERAIDAYGYVGAFWSVIVRRLAKEDPPRTQTVETQSSTVETPQIVNDYIPLAHRE